MEDLSKRLEEAKLKGETLVLTEEDLKLEIDNTGKEIKSIDDMVLVHATNYLPVGAIKTPNSTSKGTPTTFDYETTDGNKIEIPYVEHDYRNTIHFCLNSVVGDHEYRTVKNVKYSIIMPLNSNKDKIVSGTECDLFSKGDVEIKEDAYILCTKDELDTVKNANPRATVIACEGPSVKPYINIFLSKGLGYKVENPTNKSTRWDDEKDHELASNIIKSNGWEYDIHNGSKWSMEENRKLYLDRFAQIINYLKNSKLLDKKENLNDITNIIYKNISTGNMMSGYSFIGDLANGDIESLSKTIFETTGINISKPYVRDDIKGSKGPFDDLAVKYSNMITEDLRQYALIEKSKDQMLSESEQFELLYRSKIGSYLEFENIGNLEPGNTKNALISKLKSKGVLTLVNEEGQKKEYQDILDTINKIDSLETRNLSELSDEDKKIVGNYINLKMFLITPETNTRSFSVTNDFNIIPWGSFLVNNVLTSKGIPVEEFREANKIVDSDKQVEELQKIFGFDNSHITVKKDTVFGVGAFMSTDFNPNECKTVKELITKATKYIYDFNALYRVNKDVLDNGEIISSGSGIKI